MPENPTAPALPGHPAVPPPESRAEYVRGMFGRIAGRYDLLNDLMTGGRHRAWKRQLVRLAGVREGHHVLDLCTGTGDLAALAAEAVGREGRVTAVDFTPEMLEVARQRHGENSITWKQGDALELPFSDATFDTVLVGFGLRNVTDLDVALGEILRVLKPGGGFGSLDLGKPRQGLLRKLSWIYEFGAIPLMAAITRSPRDAYAYLPASNLAFPDQRELARRLEAVGFQDARVHDRALGAIAMVVGRKP